jgi:signal transduction histidine kinase/CheY-like chemotaxis protein
MTALKKLLQTKLNFGPTQRNSEIDRILCQIVLQQTLPTLALSAAALLLAFWLLHSHVKADNFELWLVAGASVVSVRCVYWLLSTKQSNKDYQRSINTYNIHTALMGMVWGALSLFWTSDQIISVQLMLLLFPVGMCAASVLSYGSWLPTYASFCIPCLFPFMYMMLMSGDPLVQSLISPLILLSTGQALLVRQHVRRIVDSEKLKFDNMSLVADLSEQNEKLTQTRDAAFAANRAKSELLARMSHEMRTPMNGVLGTADLLGHTQLNDMQSKYIRTIQKSGELLLVLINDVLDMAKIESGSFELDPHDYELHEVVNSVVDNLQAVADEKGIALNCTVEPTVPRYLHGDSHRLQQMLLNLVGNAVKFTEQGEVELRISIPEASANATFMRIDVRDSGIGIEPHRLDAIFDAFQQADGSVTRRFGGTGLGLSIARDIAQLMGGDVEVSSKPGQGSTFSIMFPLTEAQTQASQPADQPVHSVVHDVADQTGSMIRMEQPDNNVHEQTNASFPLFTDCHLLVAEDNPVNQMLVEAILESLGVAFVIVANGQEALDAMAAQRFDLVLMDCQMPVVDGLSSTSIARARGDKLPIIAVTANAMTGDRERCLEAGMDDYLSKPFKTEDIVLLLEIWGPSAQQHSKAA